MGTDRTFDPANPSTFSRPGEESFLPLLNFLHAARPVAIPAVVAGVWYVTVGFRTTDEGGPWPLR